MTDMTYAEMLEKFDRLFGEIQAVVDAHTDNGQLAVDTYIDVLGKSVYVHHATLKYILQRLVQMEISIPQNRMN